MKQTDSFVFYEMLTEKQRDPNLNEDPGVLLRQSPPQIDDEVLIGSQRPWRVVNVESYGVVSVAWIVRADLPMPLQETWITELRKEFYNGVALSICMSPDRKLLQWGMVGDEWAENRIGERLYDYLSTGKKYTVIDDIESEVIEATPNQWVIDRLESFKPESPEASYTRIDLYWCREAAIPVAA